MHTHSPTAISFSNYKLCNNCQNTKSCKTLRFLVKIEKRNIPKFNL